MAEAKECQRISVRRTDDVECLLELVWTLRPELRGKVKLTLILSFNALAQQQQMILSASSPLGSAGAEYNVRGQPMKEPEEESSSDDDWEC